MLAKEVVLLRHSSQGHHQGAEKASTQAASRAKEAATARQALRCRRLQEGSTRLYITQDPSLAAASLCMCYKPL